MTSNLENQETPEFHALWSCEQFFKIFSQLI